MSWSIKAQMMTSSPRRTPTTPGSRSRSRLTPGGSTSKLSTLRWINLLLPLKKKPFTFTSALTTSNLKVKFLSHSIHDAGVPRSCHSSSEWFVWRLLLAVLPLIHMSNIVCCCRRLIRAPPYIRFNGTFSITLYLTLLSSIYVPVPLIGYKHTRTR